MSEHKSGPCEGVEGVKGKAKEAAGSLVDNDNLRDEGKAQQDKAESQRDAAKKETEAEKERAESAVQEKRQSAYQHDQ